MKLEEALKVVTSKVIPNARQQGQHGTVEALEMLVAAVPKPEPAARLAPPPPEAGSAHEDTKKAPPAPPVRGSQRGARR